MRADRLLSIVLLLQQHNHLKAKLLAETLGVTERTIYRDIEALSLAGVPVHTRPGPDGGCFLDDHYRSSLNWFTGAELQTLLYASSASPLSALGMRSAMDNAMLKLLALLPTHYQQQAGQLKQRLYLDPSGWYGSTEEHPRLLKLKEAVWGDFLIEVLYETWEGEKYPHTLAPYSLVYKSDRWYLVAKRQDSGEMRTYRVSRIADVKLQTTPFERNPNFDIVAYWEEASQQFMQQLPSYPVTLRIRPQILIYFQHIFPGRYDVAEKTEDWWTLHVQYRVYEEARASVLGLGIDAEVIHPLELHTAVIEHAKALLEKHFGSCSERVAMNE